MGPFRDIHHSQTNWWFVFRMTTCRAQTWAVQSRNLVTYETRWFIGHKVRVTEWHNPCTLITLLHPGSVLQGPESAFLLTSVTLRENLRPSHTDPGTKQKITWQPILLFNSTHKIYSIKTYARGGLYRTIFRINYHFHTATWHWKTLQTVLAQNWTQ